MIKLTAFLLTSETFIEEESYSVATGFIKSKTDEELECLFNITF